MKLIDFLEDADFNRLRQAMGASEYGRFFTFDPERHLSQSELESLGQGMTLKASVLHQQLDRTLSYKNSRIWVIENNQFHIANCEKIKRLRLAGSDVLISNQLISKEFTVCPHCLLELQYQGLDARRMRRMDFVEQLIKNFSLDEYCEHYPIHPIN